MHVAALWLALAAGRAAPGPAIVVYEPRFETHRRFVEALSERAPQFVAYGLEERWPALGRPRVAVAVGDAATQRLRIVWPGAPLAAVLGWREVAATAPTDLTIPMRPDNVCTAAHLRTTDNAGWTVVAAPDDAGAPDLARRLRATLVQGSPSDARAALHAARPQSVWLRASVQHAVPPWLEFLGRNARAGIYVGGDAPGLARFGIDVPVTRDLHDVAERVAAWSRPRTRRRNTRPKEAPRCAR